MQLIQTSIQLPFATPQYFTVSSSYVDIEAPKKDMNMNMNLFNHNNNSADDYVQLNSCGCWIVRLAKPALKTIQ